MEVDTVIRNGKVVTTEGIFAAGIAVQGGKIAVIAAGEHLPPSKEVIDAQGNFILPGLVDGHTHLLHRHSVEEWAENLQTETRAAAAGGCTTVIHCLAQHGAGRILDAFEKVKGAFEENGYIDLGLNAAIFTLEQVREMRPALEKGISSFKFLIPYKGRDAVGDRPGIDDGLLYIGFEEIGRLVRKGYKTFARVHTETVEIFWALEDRCKEQGIDPVTYTQVRPPVLEAESLQRCIAFAKATGCPLFVLHQSIKEGPAIAGRAKLEGVDIVVETCPQYLVLNTENTDRMLSKVNPPVRLKEDNEALWQAVRDGGVDFVATDHAEVTRAKRGNDFWRAPVGLAQLETWLPIMLSAGVNAGRITLERLVQVCCHNPAKKYGLAPQKGMIAPGSDADLVIVDLKKQVKVRSEDLYTNQDYSTYEGWELQGWPVLTMLRGKIIMKNGRVTGQPGFGRYIPAGIKR